MSADAFDDWSWCKEYFREWAAINVPCSDRSAVETLREQVFCKAWAEVTKEEAALHGKEISFTFERPQGPDDLNFDPTPDDEEGENGKTW